jgi:hypothetical protein
MRHRIFPFVLIAVGGLFLLVNLGLLPREELRQFFATWWPLAPLVAGVVLLRRQGGHGNIRRCGRGEEAKTLPAAEA